MSNSELDKLYARLVLHDGERMLCLATTANVNNPPLLVGSARLADSALAGNLILRDAALLPALVDRFDDVVSMFFVDCEVKANVDLAVFARAAIAPQKLHFFKPNDFTLEAADEWIAQRMPNLIGARTAVIGAGNIGAKLALRLAERGCKVKLVGRRTKLLEDIVRGLNAIMRGAGSIVASTDIGAACADVRLIVGCTPGTPAVDAEVLAAAGNTLLLDVGNGCFSPEAIAAAQGRGLMIEVLSPTAGWEGFMRRYLATRKLQQGLGRRHLDNGIWIVSRGVMGSSGDVLVDEVSRPSRVIGICNGSGDLLYDEEAMQRVKYVEESLGIV